MTDGEQLDALAQEVDRLADGVAGQVGCVVKNLATGEEISRQPDRAFPSASVIKWPILSALHAFVGTAGVRWDQVVDPSAARDADGSGVLRHLSSSVRLNYRDLAWLMIAVSDNAATNVILDTIGLERTNRLIHALISPDLTVLRQAGKGTNAVGDSMGIATPRALVRHLEMLVDGRLRGAAETLAVGRQQLYHSDLSRYVREPIDGRPGVITATKGGSVAGVRNDVGLLEVGETKIVAAVMTERPVESGLDVADEAQRCIGEIARAALRAWTDPAVVA